MRLARLLFHIPLFILLLMTSCEYKPHGEYFLNLSAKPPPGVLITIPGHTDTLLAVNYQTYNVQVACENRTVLFHRLYVDGVLKVTRESGNSFQIDPFEYVHQDGIYRLTVEIGINTGSGSIADVLGAEGYLFQKDFMLVVMWEQVGFYPDLRFDRSNGGMKVILDVPSNVTNIRKSVFSKRVGESPTTVFATATGNFRFEAPDPLYVGELASYSVQTYIGDPAGTTFYPFVSGSRTSDPDLPVVTTGTSAKGFPVIRWNKTHYPANCAGYRVYGNQLNIPRVIQFLGTVNNINDTVFEPPGAVFPAYYEFRVAPVPLQAPSWYTDQLAWESYSMGATAYTGLNSFYFNRFISPDGPMIYYTSTSDEIVEYSIETNAITDVIGTSSGWFYTFSVSPNGKYLLAATGSKDFSYLLYDLVSNQSTWVPSSQVIGSGAETGIISVADNGIGSVITGTRMVVYDFLHQVPVTEQNFPTWGDRTVISADGQFIFAEAANLYLYKLSAGILQQKWVSSSQPGTFSYYSFEPSRPSKARIMIDQTLYTKDCETWTTEGSFNPDFDNICNIDFANGHILGKTATSFKVIDLNTGNLQFQNPTVTNSMTTDLRIKKNTVYHTSGKKLIIF
ncbi:MAG: hypothetical protein WCK09_19255 [Bacteroidota bacterium]